MRKQRILDTILGSSEHRNNEVLYHCPKCNHHKRKLSINLNKGAFKCWVCEFSGTNLGYLVKKYGSYNQYMEWNSLDPSYGKFLLEESRKEESLELPESFISLCSASHRIIHQAALNYLRGRGIDDENIFDWKIGFCYEGNYKDRIVIPSFNREGVLNYFIARSFVGNKIKYLNPRASKDIIFNDLMIDWSKPIVLVEGIFDAFKMENSIPILGSTLSVESKLFQKIVASNTKVYMALDHDAQTKEGKIIKDLLLYGAQVYKIDVPIKCDIGDLSKEECKLIKQKANFVESTDYLLYQKIFSEAF